MSDRGEDMERSVARAPLTALEVRNIIAESIFADEESDWNVDFVGFGRFDVGEEPATVPSGRRGALRLAANRVRCALSGLLRVFAGRGLRAPVGGGGGGGEEETRDAERGAVGMSA